jgi:hypothetical protein
MPEHTRWPREAWPPLLAGLLWLWLGADGGFAGALLSLLPGVLLLGAGASLLLMPGDRRIANLAALGGVAGVLLALPAAAAIGLAAALALVALSAAGAVAAGAHAVRLEPNLDEVPEPVPGLRLSAQVAVDEALMASMLLTIPFPRHDDYGRLRREAEEAREQFEAQGFLEKPEGYHREPPPLLRPELRAARARGLAFEHLSFESGYEPRAGEPGRERWLGYAPNRTAHAWVARHSGGERPWLVCLHGYQMGIPLFDWSLFPPEWLHQRLGLNLLLPVLPLHGPRKIGRRSGDGYLAGDVLDTLHAQAQALWDARRLLGWVRSQGSAPLGVLGYSLGGCGAALLASLESELACAVPGIPVADFTRLFYRHGPALELRSAEQAGLHEQTMRAVFRPVTPLALPPRIPLGRRYLFGAVADRITPPDHVRDLWRHWERPTIAWYQGGHVSFRLHPQVRQLIERGLRESGLVA